MPAALAAEVSQERKDRSTSDLVSRGNNIQGSPTAQSDSGRYNTETYTMPLKMGQHPLEVSTGRQSSSSLPSATDATPLLSGAMKRKNSWGNLGLKVTSYLGLADDRALLLQSYDDADAKLNLFKDTYNEEVGHMLDRYYEFILVHAHMYLIYIYLTQCNVDMAKHIIQVKKVKDFYKEKTDEISQRMEVLVESVDTSVLNKIKPKKEKHSLVESITNKFESMMAKGGSSHHRRGSLPQMELQFSESLDDVDVDPEHKPSGGGGGEKDDFEKKRKKEDLLRKSDSIKRAITDIYRTSKLLHNYSIMNYTGFVKIAKKFDKTFPDHKGAFKGNNCDDGKQAELLAAKMESIYSKWFCQGDVREAQAQMLPKRGDGLLMDWTQLRLGYRLGMCSILATWVAWDCVWGQFARGEVSIGGRSAFPVFRACFGLLAWHCKYNMELSLLFLDCQT